MELIIEYIHLPLLAMIALSGAAIPACMCKGNRK